ncbi:MAG: DNA primase [Candidatus Cloacimonadota bacterium]|nr:MAG: DNA primase [Candidatus Cloacimonadota bacterium]
MKRYYIDQKIIEEIRNAADIIDTIGEYICIKKAGKNYTGLCPFHSEKKPSFTVSPAKQLYHCFGCGKSGNVISFVMNYETVSFIEAIEILAKKYGITLTKKKLSDDDKIRQDLFNANEFAFGFFRRKLKEAVGKKAMAYLRKRNVSNEIIDTFGLGFAPDGWDNLLKSALKNNIPKELLYTSGVLVKNEKGHFYDRFRNRIMFTFYNSIGKKIGFAGRTLGNDMAKYLNIPESPLYKKRFTLYGIYQAKETIRNLDRCLVVEGYTDLLSLFQEGFTNSVAISGTSLTDEQTRILRRYTRNIYISFDADKPGKDATLRSISIFIKNGLVPYIITLPKGRDPDDIVKKEGKEEFQKYVDHALHFIDFKMNYMLSRYDTDNPVEKTEIIREMSKTIAQVEDITERQEWLSKIGKKLSVDETIFLGVKKKLTRDQFEPSVLSVMEMCNDLVLLLAMKPERYGEVFKVFKDEGLLTSSISSILSYINEKRARKEAIRIANVLDLIEDDKERKRVSSTVFNIKDDLPESDFQKMFHQYIKRIRTIKLKERWKLIKSEIQKKEDDHEAVCELLQEQGRIATLLKNVGGNIGR